ncbi:MAG: hypothetical protein AAGJ46_19890 [Planctomycetota bacterium]
MKLLDRLEKRFGGYAVENSTLVVIVGQVIVFLAQYSQPGGAADLFERLQLDPSKVLAGEVWRLVTFMFLAPLHEWPLFVFFFWYLFYLMGTALEQAWSVFRYNLFCGISYVALVGSAFLAHALAPGLGVANNDYLYGSIFLAFARLFPDFQLMLFFLIPIKIKWLALLQWIGYGLTFAVALNAGDWYIPLTIAAAVANYFLFFGGDIVRDIRHGHRRNVWRAKALKTSEKLSHECRVCGLTSDMAPKTAFRYCSKCAGQACYCPDHIKDHEHVTEDEVRD